MPCPLDCIAFERTMLASPRKSRSNAAGDLYFRGLNAHFSTDLSDMGWAEEILSENEGSVSRKPHAIQPEISKIAESESEWFTSDAEGGQHRGERRKKKRRPKKQEQVAAAAEDSEVEGERPKPRRTRKKKPEGSSSRRTRTTEDSETPVSSPSRRMKGSRTMDSPEKKSRSRSEKSTSSGRSSPTKRSTRIGSPQKLSTSEHRRSRFPLSPELTSAVKPRGDRSSRSTRTAEAAFYNVEPTPDPFATTTATFDAFETDFDQDNESFSSSPTKQQNAHFDPFKVSDHSRTAADPFADPFALEPAAEPKKPARTSRRASMGPRASSRQRRRPSLQYKKAPAPPAESLLGRQTSLDEFVGSSQQPRGRSSSSVNEMRRSQRSSNNSVSGASLPGTALKSKKSRSGAKSVSGVETKSKSRIKKYQEGSQWESNIDDILGGKSKNSLSTVETSPTDWEDLSPRKRNHFV